MKEPSREQAAATAVKKFRASRDWSASAARPL
jgi:hypothetical protein